jgi:hypothetical protein
MLLAGLAAAAITFRRSPSARTLIALLLAYPLADALARHDGPHLLRSAPGIAPLAMAAGLGGASLYTWAAAKKRALAIGLSCAIAAWAAFSTARFAHTYFGAYNRDVTTWQYFNADLLEALAWVKPRLADVDELWVSMTVSSAMDQPFVLSLSAWTTTPSAGSPTHATPFPAATPISSVRSARSTSSSNPPTRRRCGTLGRTTDPTMCSSSPALGNGIVASRCTRCSCPTAGRAS